MNRKFFFRESLILIVLFAPIIYLLIVWDQLPEELPIHWNIKGEVDNYGPKYLFPLISIALYVILLIIPKIDPRKGNYDIFSSTYYKLRFALILFFSAINVLIILSGTGVIVDISRIVVVGILLLFIVLGNYLSNIRPNWFIGIRTPWTLENEEVWRKTHSLASKLWFWIGLITLIVSFLLPGRLLFPVVLIVVIMISLIPVVHSFVLYRKLK